MLRNKYKLHIIRKTTILDSIENGVKIARHMENSKITQPFSVSGIHGVLSVSPLR